MSTHNICFHGEIRKNIDTFGLKKSILSRIMLFRCLNSVDPDHIPLNAST